MKPALFATLALVAITACGQDDGAPGPADAATVDGGCQPQSSSGFSPLWKPPHTTPNACTDAQIDEAYRRCESASAMPADCAAFSRDAAHAACRNCLYSTADESRYGPLVYLRNRVLSVNVPGCLALADGNLGPQGCGAHLQAFESCKDDACIGTCATFDAYQRCIVQAGNTVCRAFVDDSTCKEPATYAPCLDNMTFEAFYRTLAKVFCGSGFAGGGKADAGANDAGADDAGLGDGGGPDADGVRSADGEGHASGRTAASRMGARERSWFYSIAPDALRTRSTVEMTPATER